MQISSSTKYAMLAAGLLFTAGSAFAHNAGEVGTATLGHLRDSNNHPVKNSFGECVHVPIGADHSADCEVKPAPPPAAAQAPAAPAAPVRQAVRQKVTLQADALFDFDKAVIKPDGRAKIDDAVAKMKAANVEKVNATGHTDSIGSDAYNMKLGQRRADAVKAYMVSKGVDGAMITATSKGESEPVASNKTKEGRAKNRRVEIEFFGSEMVTPK